MRKFLPLGAAGAWLLIVAGTAMAQVYNQGPLPPTGPSSLAITGPDTSPPLPASAVGQNLLTNRNDIIGYIMAVRNDSLIVRPGSHFGFSPRAVIVPRDDVYVQNGIVRTYMNGSKLASMPRYIPPTASNR